MKVVDELDPQQYKVTDIELIHFLKYFDHTYMDKTKPKGPDYLIMDNFLENFELNVADLLYARREAEEISTEFCTNDIGTEQRCDLLFWIKGVSDEYSLTSFKKIYKSVAALKPLANEFSQSAWGDKSLYVDEEEIVVARYNGASNKEQHYLRHKDSYMRDENNKIHG